jgi:hypothetical protein
MTEAAALTRLRETYSGTGFEVRFFPACVTNWRFQLGYISRNGRGEQFTLIAFSSTPHGLLDAIEKRAKALARGCSVDRERCTGS